MSKESEKTANAQRTSAVNLTTRLATVRYLNEITSSYRGRAIPIQPIADALIAAGYNALDEQAKALGLNRSTVWTIVKNKHKLGRLNMKTTKLILANPDTPSSVRAVIQQHLDERLVTTLPESIE